MFSGVLIMDFGVFKSVFGVKFFTDFNGIHKHIKDKYTLIWEKWERVGIKKRERFMDKKF